MWYLNIGIIYASLLFIIAELSKNYFSEILGLKTFSAFITDLRVLMSFSLLVLFWPIGVAFLILNLI
jgi:hypothetical protein